MKELVVDFRQARTHADLAVMIGCPLNYLEHLISSPTRREWYYELHIPKKNRRRRGEYRTVWQARIPLSWLQKSLLRKLEIFFSDVLTHFPHQSAHGYVRGRNIASNAAPHAGQKFLLRADVEDFFGSISRVAIEAFFESIGVCRTVAQALAALSTIDDVLGQGIHTSPLLANVMCLELDDALSDLAATHGCRYTRYADDIAISGPTELPGRLAVAAALARFGFKLSVKKYRETMLGQAHFVTGLSVSDGIPRIPRRFKRRLRQELYFAGKVGIEEHAERAGYPTIEKCVNTIDGRISFFRSIEPELGGRLNCVWQDILERDKVRPTYKHARIRRTKDVFLFVDESWVEMPNEQLLAVGVVLTEDVKRISKEICELRSQILVDPFASGRKHRLHKKGFHFSEDSEETRAAFVKLIAQFPIRAFVALKRVSNKAEFKTHYLQLLKCLLFDRLSTQFSFRCHIVVEEHSEIRQQDVDDVLESVRIDLAKANRRPVFKPSLTIASKSDAPCMAVTDYLLGVTAKYMTEPKGETASKRFERLRDKIRLVLDVDTGNRYCRKNPLSSESLVAFRKNSAE